MGTISGLAGLTGVPFLSTAAVIVSQITDRAQNVLVHKEKCKALAGRCRQYLLALSEQSSALDGVSSPISDAISQYENITHRILSRITTWSQLDYVRSFVKQEEIATALDNFNVQLDDCGNIFQVTSHVTLHQRANEIIQIQNRDHEEQKEMLQNILRNQQLLAQVMGAYAETPGGMENFLRAIQTEIQDNPRERQQYPDTPRGVNDVHQMLGLPPPILDLTKEVTLISAEPVAGGQFSDVWMGDFLRQGKVALKGLRAAEVTSEVEQHEVSVWRRLQHGNILKFLGTAKIGPQKLMVSPWQEYGNFIEFLHIYPNVNRLKLLADVAAGLTYMHSSNVVHADLKGSNILVSASGNASICDFGRSLIVDELIGSYASHNLTDGESVRWLAPELIKPDTSGYNTNGTSSPTFASDRYAFSMCILEALTLQHPFAQLQREYAVINAIVSGLKPPRPNGPCERWLDDELWALMESCWQTDPRRRPTMAEVTPQILRLSQNT